jgi:transposase
LRYLSDRTDEEWALVEPLIPRARRDGNKRGTLGRMHDALLCALARGRLARGAPDRRHHRQPECQEREKGVILEAMPQSETKD